MTLSDSQVQMTLDLDTGLTERFRSVKEVVAAGVYRRGLKRCAGDLDVAPGNLSVQLAGDGQRHFDVDLERVQAMLSELPTLLASAGMNKRRSK